MKSIGARLAIYYAAAATASAAVLLVAGYLLLETRLVHGLDQLNISEFEQLRVRLGPDYSELTPEAIDKRIRETADAASELFFINVDEPRSGMVFYSSNLKQKPIPDVKGLHRYNAFLPGTGEIRVGEFIAPPFDISIATPMTQARASMRSYVEISAVLLATMLLASLLIGFGFARVLLRPLVFVRETAKRISSDNLGERIPVPVHRDELSDLAALLNQMFDRLERSFEQIKRFSAEASHELKTPLSLIRLHGEHLLENDTLPPSAIEAILVQLEEVERLDQTIEAMLFLSRAEAKAVPLHLNVTDPEPALRVFEQDAIVLSEHFGCKFVLEMQGQCEVAFEEKWLRQVWLNLLTNALNVSTFGGTVLMSTRVSDGFWEFAVEDEGPGLAEAELAHIFDRFSQFGPLDQRTRGSGLGLAIVQSIVNLHSGEIWALNRKVKSGLCVTVRLPTREPLAADRPRAAPSGYK